MDKISYAMVTQVVLCVLPLYCDSRSLNEILNYDLINGMDCGADILKSKKTQIIKEDEENIIIKPQKQNNEQDEKFNRKNVEYNSKIRKERSIIPQKSRSQNIMLVFQKPNPWAQNTKLPQNPNAYQGIKTVYFNDEFENYIPILTALNTLERAAITFPQAEELVIDIHGLMGKEDGSQERQSEYILDDEEHESEKLSKNSDEVEQTEDGTLGKVIEEDEKQEDEEQEDEDQEVEEKEDDGQGEEEQEHEEHEDERQEDETRGTETEEDEYEDEEDEEEQDENEEDEEEQNENEEDDVQSETTEEGEEQDDEPLDKTSEKNEEQRDEATLNEDTNEDEDNEHETISRSTEEDEEEADVTLDNYNEEDEVEDKETLNKSSQEYKNEILGKYIEGDREEEGKSFVNGNKEDLSKKDETLNTFSDEFNEQKDGTIGKDSKGYEELKDKILGKDGEVYEQDVNTVCIYTGGNEIEDKNCFSRLALKSILHKLKKRPYNLSKLL